MWLCGIMACVLLKEKVKHRTSSLWPHASHCKPNPSTGSQQTTALVDTLLVPCWRPTKQTLFRWCARRVESGDKHPLIQISLSPYCLSIYFSVPPSPLFNPVCFSSKGKLKPVGFVFLLLLAVCPLLKPRCWWTENQKNMRWIVQVGGSEWRGGRKGGRLTQLWCLPQFWMFLVSKPVGKSFSCQSNTQKHIPSELESQSLFFKKENIVYHICPTQPS